MFESHMNTAVRAAFFCFVFCLAFCMCDVMNKIGTCDAISLMSWGNLFLLFTVKEQTNMAAP